MTDVLDLDIHGLAIEVWPEVDRVVKMRFPDGTTLGDGWLFVVPHAPGDDYEIEPEVGESGDEDTEGPRPQLSFTLPADRMRDIIGERFVISLDGAPKISGPVRLANVQSVAGETTVSITLVEPQALDVSLTVVDGGAGGTVGAIAACILHVADLTPTTGDPVLRVGYRPDYDAEVSGLAVGWEVLGEHLWGDEEWDAAAGSHVLLLPANEQYPTIYATATADGFVPVDLSGGSLVTVACGGANASGWHQGVWAGWNFDYSLSSGPDPAAPAVFFAPIGVNARDVDVDGTPLDQYLTGVALLAEANLFTEPQSIDVAVPAIPAGLASTTKPTVLVHLHGNGSQIVDHASAAIDLGDWVFRAAGNLVQILDSDGAPTDEWLLTSGGGNGAAILLVTSSDPGELPYLSDLMMGTPAPLTVGAPTANAHAATKGWSEAAFAAIGHGHGGDYSPVGVGAGAGLPTGNWLLVCDPNGVSSSFSTPDFGPFTTGADVRMRVAAIDPDPARTGEDVVSFLEALTQIRQAPGGWGSDQDNLELALAIQNGDVGVFAEHCKTSTPAPVEAGEYVAGRVSSLPSYNPDTYDYIDSSFRLRLNEAATLRWTYEFDVAGQWRQRWWREVGEQDADVRTDDDGRYWRIILTNTGTDGPGSIADAEMPFVIGTNDGLLAVEWLVARDGIEGTVVAHFHADDLQLDGTVESSVVTGQTWSPTGTPVHIDTTLLGLASGDGSGVPTSRLITAGTGLTGGGDLSADRSIAVAYGLTASTAVEGIALPRSSWRTGSFYTTNGRHTSTAQAMASGVVRAMPFYNPVAGRTLDQIAVDVASASGTPAAYLYIMLDDGTGYPGSVVASCAVTPAAASRVPAAASYTLPRGLLFFVAHSTAATWAGQIIDGQSPYLPSLPNYSTAPGANCWLASGAGTSLLTAFPAGGSLVSSGIAVHVRSA